MIGAAHHLYLCAAGWVRVFGLEHVHHVAHHVICYLGRHGQPSGCEGGRHRG